MPMYLARGLYHHWLLSNHRLLERPLRLNPLAVIVMFSDNYELTRRREIFNLLGLLNPLVLLLIFLLDVDEHELRADDCWLNRLVVALITGLRSDQGWLRGHLRRPRLLLLVYQQLLLRTAPVDQLNIAELPFRANDLLLLLLLHLNCILSLAHDELFVDHVLVLETLIASSRGMRLLHQHRHRVNYLLPIRSYLTSSSEKHVVAS